MKTCTKCKQDKPLEDFSIHKKGKYLIGKPKAECKECSSKRMVQWQKDNKERVNEYQLKQYYKNKKVI